MMCTRRCWPGRSGWRRCWWGTGEAELVQGELGDGFAAGRRASPLRKAGLSSGAMGSHLITLGEFIGMYLLVWSPVLWAVAGLDGVAALADFRASLPRVRRALAHIPTGMMFDDHEVTDDWNIRQSWVDGVGRSALGRRVVRNALAAYAVFQHWGNVPREFSGGRPGAEVLKALAGGAGAGAPEALDEVLGALPSGLSGWRGAGGGARTRCSRWWRWTAGRAGSTGDGGASG
ncbi:MAG: hypothetical protein R3F43_18455 [bacterium]